MGGKNNGSILDFTYHPGLPCLLRGNSFNSVLKSYPAIKVLRHELEIQNVPVDSESTAAAWLLTSPTKPIGVFGCYDDPSIGAISALKELGFKAGQVKVFGFNAGPPALAAIRVWLDDGLHVLQLRRRRPGRVLHHPADRCRGLEVAPGRAADPAHSRNAKQRGVVRGKVREHLVAHGAIASLEKIRQVGIVPMGNQEVRAEVPIVEVRNLSKRFGAVKALTDVSLQVRAGEVCGLVGANGAGKSTLIRVLAGAHQPDSGTILIDGSSVSIRDPAHATELGLNFIHQELSLVPKMTALQNLTLGLKKPSHAGAFIDWRATEREVAPVAERLNMGFRLSTKVQQLSIADQWLVAIGRALLRRARVIAMDEATASLSDDETQRLFRLIRELADSGVAILYVTHRLHEVTELCDTVTVFRDGRSVRSLRRSEVSRPVLVQEIIGRRLETTGYEPRIETSNDKALLEVKHLVRRPSVRDVSFSVHAGEVLGLAGLVGAGRTEVARLIFGADRAESGEIWLDGERLDSLTPPRAVDKGIALVPEERRTQGLILSESVMLNVNLSSLQALRLAPRSPFISKKRGRERAHTQVNNLGIKTPGVNTRVSQLSGGNQQKVVIAKWLVRAVKILILDEPTRGVDVSTRAEMYLTIRRLAAEGRGVLMISSEFDEFALCCDRVLVMAEGRIVGSLTGAEITENRILELSYGSSVSSGVLSE